MKQPLPVLLEILLVLSYVSISIISLSACRSNSVLQEATDMLHYESVNLEFSFNYPKDWAIFETSEVMIIAKHTEQLIVPEEDRLREDGDAILLLSVIEHEMASDFITALHSATDEGKVDIANLSISQFSDLSAAVAKEIYEELNQSYQAIFIADEPMALEFMQWENAMIIGDGQSSSPIKKYYVVRNIEEAIIILLEITYKEYIDDAQYISKSIEMVNSVEIVIQEGQE